MTNKDDTPATQLPEWPSLGFDYCDNFGFATRATESGEWPDFNTFGCAGEMDLIRNWRCALIITQLPSVCPGVWSLNCSAWCCQQLIDRPLIFVHTGFGPRLLLHSTACAMHGVGFQCSVVRVDKVSVTYFPLVVKKLAPSARFVAQ